VPVPGIVRHYRQLGARPYGGRLIDLGYSPGIPLVIVTVSNEPVGLAAALLYAVVFTVELLVGLVTYFGGEAKA